MEPGRAGTFAMTPVFDALTQGDKLADALVAKDEGLRRHGWLRRASDDTMTREGAIGQMRAQITAFLSPAELQMLRRPAPH